MTIDTVRVRMAYTTNHAMRHITPARVTRITMRHSYMAYNAHAFAMWRTHRLTGLHGPTKHASHRRRVLHIASQAHASWHTFAMAHAQTVAECADALDALTPRSVAAMRASCPHERALPSKSERRPTCARGRCRAPRRPSHPPLCPESRLLLPNASDSRKHTRRLQERRMHESCRPAHTCQHKHATSQCVI